MKHLLFACVAMAMASAPAVSALADDLESGQSRAVLATPAAKPVEFTIDGRVWRCDAAVHLGAFTSYQTGSKTLTGAQLADCNANLTK